jgi:cardiolipin synthase C
MLACLLLVTGCASLPPGNDYPKTESSAFAQPETTALGQRLAAQAAEHPGLSGFGLFPRGLDGLLLRTQLIRSAQGSLDIQYYVFVEDYTGKLLLDGVLHAADRGVRVRLLIDDLNAFATAGTRKTLAALDRHRNIEIRLFNPFAYRGDVSLLQRLEFVLNAQRLNHRMHNKLLIADSAIAIVGGRNVADEYFDTGALSVRFGDLDVAAVGPVVHDLAQSFDAYWNCALAIPQEALPPPVHTPMHEVRADLAENRAETDVPAIMRRLEAGNPLAGLLDGRIPLEWARATMIADPPEKAEAGSSAGRSFPTSAAIDALVDGVSHDLIVISPYFIPGQEGQAALERLLKRGVRVRILTNSLASTDVPAVHGAYRRYRSALLAAGAEIFEVRPVPGTAGENRESHAGGGSAGAGASGSSGASGAPFALHAKACVFDDRTVFLGSANLDPRSFELNTEVGLLIESPAIAAQVIRRFGEFSSSENSYEVVLAPEAGMTWRTEVGGTRIDWRHEPDTTLWQRFKSDLYTLMLPLERQL